MLTIGNLSLMISPFIKPLEKPSFICFCFFFEKNLIHWLTMCRIANDDDDDDYEPPKKLYWKKTNKHSMNINVKKTSLQVITISEDASFRACLSSSFGDDFSFIHSFKSR